MKLNIKKIKEVFVKKNNAGEGYDAEAANIAATSVLVTETAPGYTDSIAVFDLGDEKYALVGDANGPLAVDCDASELE